VTSPQKGKNWTISERDEFVTIVIGVMIKFNKGVVMRPSVFNLCN
jgi:hypothetical protein